MRTGRPKAPLVLTEPKRHALEGLARRARTAPAGGAAGAHRAGLCAGPRQPDGREEAAGLGADGGALARAVCRPAGGRPVR